MTKLGDGGETPWKLTWNTKMEVLKMIFLFNWLIFMFHVNFLGCRLKKNKKAP